MKDTLAILFQMLVERFRDFGIPPKHIAMGGAGVLLLGLLTCTVCRTTSADLLDAKSLSPGDVRKIATTLLLHDDVRVRERANLRLATAGKTAAPVLKEIGLTTEDPRLAEAVTGVLLTVDADAAVAVLEHLIGSSDVEARRTAVQSASRWQDPRTTAILTKALQDADGGIRLSAASALGARKAQDGVGALEQAMKDQSPGVRRHAARALQSITGKDYRTSTESEK
jgi:HEAT repeat protein